MLSNTERQRRFKDKMYKAGFKQIVLWVKRMEKKHTAKITQGEFMKRLMKNTSGWKKEELSELLYLFLNITNSKKEAFKINK